MKITEYFISHFKLTNMILVFVVLTGGITMMSLPRQDSPNVDFNVMSISTFYPGASPEDVEVNVTDPIEDELGNIDGIEELTSFSIEGMSYIVAQLDPDADDADEIKEDVRSAVDRVSDLPQAVENRPLIKELKATDFPVIELAIVGPMDEEERLRKVTKDIESEIKAIDGVGNIQKINYRKKEIKILCDADKMQEHEVSFADILTAIKARNVKLSGGTLESYVDQKKIVTFSEFDHPLDVADVIIRSNFSGKHIRVRDIAEVVSGFKKKDLITRSGGVNSINMIIKRSGSADVIRLSKKIDAVVKKYQAFYKNDSISVVKVVDFSYYTKSLLNIVIKNALIGFSLVVISLFVFLNLHTAFWVAVGIPVSFFGAYIFLPLFDINTNQITLITMILVLGMLVDDAIVIAENISRHQEDGEDPVRAAVMGTEEVYYPVLATIITSMLCFIPMFFMKGIMGKFIASIPIVVILTLSMSLLESITLLPAHLSRGKKNNPKKEVWMNRLREVYAKWLRKCLRLRRLTLLIFVLILVSAVSFFSKHGKINLFPTDDYDFFYVVMETETGDSLSETSKKVEQIEKVVAKIPADLMMEFKTIVGDHRTDEAVSNPTLHENWALVTVFLHPSSKRNIKSEAIIKDLQKQFKNIKGFKKLEVREVQDGPPVGQPITIRLVSDDFVLAERYEKKVLNFIQSMDGIYDLESSNKTGKQEVRLKLDHDYMAKVGITALDFATVLRVAYDGNIATTIRRDGEEIDFRVKLRDEQRGNLDVLTELQVPNKENRLIKVKDVASLEFGWAKQSISHFNGKKAVLITAKVYDEIITSSRANQELKDKFVDDIEAVPGLEIVFGGQEKETMKSMKNFVVAFAVGILCIYAVLVVLLDSFSQPFLILIAVPFGFIGVLIAFYIHGLSLSFIGLIGTLGMMGVVVNDSLVMVTYLNTLKSKNLEMNLDLIIEGSKTRLRPVLLTTITTVLGLLPTVYGWGFGADGDGHELGFDVCNRYYADFNSGFI